MTKHSIQSGDGSDSDLDSVVSHRTNKLGAILCPAICALILVCIFVVSFVGTKMAYEQYDTICRSQYNLDNIKRYLKFKDGPHVTGPKSTSEMFVTRPI